MITKPKILTALLERITFLILVACALLYVWSVPAFITMDGPAHLYNASLLNIYHESSFLQQYLELNSAFLPNYLSHWILQGLLLVFDFFTAEKVLVSLIVIFLPVTFRLLVKSITSEVPFYSFIIFPLVFTNLLQYGFYNFSLGFVFLNLHIYLISEGLKKRKLVYMTLLLVNSFALYYCHLFGFAMAMLVSVVYVIIYHWRNKTELMESLGFFMMVHLPTVIFGAIFFLHTDLSDFDYDLQPYEKILNLLSFSPGIIFEKRDELLYASLISVLLISLVVHALTLRFDSGKTVLASDLFLVLALGAIYLIFHTKDGAMGGMFIQRLLCLVFYFLILWVACNAKPGYITLFALFVVVFQFAGVSYKRNIVTKSVQSKLIGVELARHLIPEKSIVQSVVLTDIWFYQHISNYLGIDKEALMLENYEASLSWFPLTWNAGMLGIKKEKNMQNYIRPDFIFIYGNEENLQYRLNDSLKNYVKSRMVMLYESSDKFCRLYGQRQ